MADIINIETSSKVCSVAISEDGRVVKEYKDTKSMNHAVSVAPFLEKCVNFLKESGKKAEAVAVSIGPGSYTGLRIGLSLAKGFAFAENIPLIGIDTLKILAAKAMFSYPEWEGTELVIPMVDARRMEVFTAVFNARLELVEPEHAEILTPESFKNFADEKKILFIGDGTEKFKNIYQGYNAVWIGPDMPLASDMAILSEMAFQKNDFLNLAYSVPNYIKDFEATVPRQKLF